MRVTNRGMMNSYLGDIQNNLQSMDKINTQLNTGKQINKISDDPLKTIKILNMRNEIESTEKNNSNCDEIMGWLDITDESLDRVSNLTSDIKTLVTSISGAYGKSEIVAVKTEVNEKIKQIGEAMNTTYGGNYIFGCSVTDKAPIKVETDEKGNLSLKVNSSGVDEDKKSDGKLVSVISSGININYNLTIDNITKTNGQKTGSKSGLDILNKLSETLNKEPLNMKEMNNLSKDLEGYISDVMSNRSIVGARTNTVESVKDANDKNILEMTRTLSEMEDINYAKKFIELKEAEMLYNSSLQVGAKLFKSTLLDYLR